MTDVAMILERLKKLARYLEFLDKIKSLTYEQYVGNQATQFAVERALQLAIQVVVDIATHILSTSGNLAPDDYRDAILKLAQAGVIPNDYANRISGMAGFRNILVHQYVNIDPRLVYKNLQEQLNDFALFGNYVNEWLNMHGLLNPPDMQ
jgi:uncharacterized protein YutE (UPF0331/DUF86 family)